MIFLWSPSWLVIVFCHFGAGFHNHTVRSESCTGGRATEAWASPREAAGAAVGSAGPQKDQGLGA